MKAINMPNSLQSLLAGTLNGFIVGVVASAAFYISNEYHNWRLLHGDLATENSSYLVQKVAPIFFILLLCFFAMIFSIASYIVHGFWLRRLESVVMLWQFVSAIAVGIGALCLVTIDLIENLLSEGSFFVIKYHNLLSLEFARLCIISLASLAVINYAYSAIIQMVWSGYRKNVRDRLNLP